MCPRAPHSSTTDDWRKYLSRDAALERRFQPVPVQAPDAAGARTMLEGLREAYESHHKCGVLTAPARFALKSILGTRS